MKRGTKLLYKKNICRVIRRRDAVYAKLELCAAERRTGSDQ